MNYDIICFVILAGALVLIFILLPRTASRLKKSVGRGVCGGWSRDVSAEIADLIAQRCAREGFDVPPSLESFVDRHGAMRPAQLHLPLRGAA